MIDLKKSRYCSRCKDKYYNENDIRSIEETKKCSFCYKEIEFERQLAEIKKKKDLQD
jgi:hypothetical protein